MLELAGRYTNYSTGGWGENINLLYENQRVGWIFFEKNKRVCPFIRDVKVEGDHWIQVLTHSLSYLIIVT